MDTIVVNSVVQKEEVGEFKALLYKAKIKLNKRQMVLLMVTVIFMLIILIYILFFRQASLGQEATGGQNPQITTWPFILLFLSVMYRLIAPVLVSRKAQREFVSNSFLMKEAEYIFAQDGIRAYSDKKALNLRWVEVYKIVETKKYIAVYENSMEMNIIPKRCFKDEEDLLAAITLLKNKLPDTKYERLEE